MCERLTLNRKRVEMCSGCRLWEAAVQAMRRELLLDRTVARLLCTLVKVLPRWSFMLPKNHLRAAKLPYFLMSARL